MDQVAELDLTIKQKDCALETAQSEIQQLKELIRLRDGELAVVAEKDSRINYLEKREESTWQALLAKAQIQIPSQPQ